MQLLLLTISLVTAVQCHTLANGDTVEVHKVFGGAVKVTLEYPPTGPPIPNCCPEAISQKPVAGAVLTEVADLRNLGYLLRLDFLQDIVTCHLVPDVGETSYLSSTLCPQLSCPAGWNLLQGSCFLVSHVSGSWDEGQTFCQQYGGALATISSHFQQLVVSEMLTNDTWIGLRHQYHNYTYGWSDGNTNTYRSWAQEEPSIPATPDMEECVEMGQEQAFLWDTAQCNQSKEFLCSIPGTVIPPTVPTTTTMTPTTPIVTPTTPIVTPTTPIVTPTTPIMTTIHISECESNWTKYQSSCYKLFDKRLIYSEAAKNCRDLGAYLVSIHSDGEQSFLKGLVTEDTYIGLSDQENEGIYTWQDGSDFNYSKWNENEPNNAGDEDCVEMRKIRDFNWNDNSCHYARQYICEKSLQ